MLDDSWLMAKKVAEMQVSACRTRPNSFPQSTTHVELRVQFSTVISGNSGNLEPELDPELDP